MLYILQRRVTADRWVELERFEDRGLALKELSNLRARWNSEFRLIEEGS